MPIGFEAAGRKGALKVINDFDDFVAEALEEEGGGFAGCEDGEADSAQGGSKGGFTEQGAEDVVSAEALFGVFEFLVKGLLKASPRGFLRGLEGSVSGIK